MLSAAPPQPLLFLLLSLHLALLLRQSQLLLRPLCDLPQTHTRRCGPATLMQRIQRHGSGAALAALPLLALLLYRSPQAVSWTKQISSLMANGTGEIWLVWAVVSLIALSATRFQHFNGLAFSSQDAGPADFGRRWPRWPDSVLWLCELCYMGMLYTVLLSIIRRQSFGGLGWWISQVIFVLLGLSLLHVYWRNWQYRKHRGLAAQLVDWQEISPKLYLLRLRLEPQLLQNLEMGFCILQFPELLLPRHQQNEHPLSMLSWQQRGTSLELEFALEMQGFFQYLKPQEIIRRNQLGQIRLWGPYYDAQPQFLNSIREHGRLLYIGSQSGLSPLLHFLQYLTDHNQTAEVQIPKMQIAVLRLEAKGDCRTIFWQQRLAEAGKRLPENICLEVEGLEIPSYLAQQASWEGSKQGDKQRSKPSKNLKTRHKILNAWLSFCSQRESEILQQQIRSYLTSLCTRWQLSTKNKNQELQPFCLYRGPSTLHRLIEQCFDQE